MVAKVKKKKLTLVKGRAHGDRPRYYRRKGELRPPVCQAGDNCQINHTIEQTAALLNCSIKTIQRLLDAGKLEYIECGLGVRKFIRVPHASVRKLARRNSPKSS
jgi:excisionase family DNA binding protein